MTTWATVMRMVMARLRPMAGPRSPWSQPRLHTDAPKATVANVTTATPASAGHEERAPHRARPRRGR